uniref:Uncharacterized protein n=1 Tax=Oncorhynchus mykiss TaxID=8022 RepID=A0A8C7LU59_ONCMY
KGTTREKLSWFDLFHILPVQKYKPYSCGVANQKWGWFPDLTVLSAFYTSSLDQEVTAANQASVCVPPVCPQNHCTSRYTRTSPEQLLGRGVLQKPPPGSSSLCCMASHNHQLSPTGHFRILKTSVWESLRTEAAVLQKQTPSPEVCSAAQTKPSVKLLAHRNGQGGLEEGQLITVATMPMVLTLHQLKAWALNDCMQDDTDTQRLDCHSDNQSTVFQVSAEDMSSVDDGLLTLILRSPIHVWVSCGEGLCGSGRRERVLTDLGIKRHKMRHLKALLCFPSVMAAVLLSCSTVRLALSRSAPRLYAADGRRLSSWVDIHRDMLLCVSTGQPFISPEGQQEPCDVIYSPRVGSSGISESETQQKKRNVPVRTLSFKDKFVKIKTTSTYLHCKGFKHC